MVFILSTQHVDFCVPTDVSHIRSVEHFVVVPKSHFPGHISKSLLETIRLISKYCRNCVV